MAWESEQEEEQDQFPPLERTLDGYRRQTIIVHSIIFICAYLTIKWKAFSFFFLTLAALEEFMAWGRKDWQKIHSFFQWQDQNICLLLTLLVPLYLKMCVCKYAFSEMHITALLFNFYFNCTSFSTWLSFSYIHTTWYLLPFQIFYMIIN